MEIDNVLTPKFGEKRECVWAVAKYTTSQILDFAGGTNLRLALSNYKVVAIEKWIVILGSC